MIRAFFTLIKIAVLVTLIVWIAERPGTIVIDWMQYKLTFHVGLFLLIILATVVLGIIIFSIIKGLLDIPKNITRYRDIKNKDKGIKALTIGLAAVAAGDARNASYQAYRARTFLKEDEALPKLLEAQAARLSGDESDAAHAFATLLNHKDASFLGVRGLLQTALDSNDYEGATELGNHALKLQPKQGWVLRLVYDLEVKTQNWDKARKILTRAEKQGEIAIDQGKSDRVAMLLAEADQGKEAGYDALWRKSLNKAYKIDPSFIPTVLALGRMYLAKGKRKSVINMVEKAWKNQPHPGLVALWDEACPQSRDNDPMERVRWFEKLLALNPESVEGLQALANVLIGEGLWGEARKHLEKAQDIRPNATLYKLWARLEERATHNDEAVRAWYEKAAQAPKERTWICAQTGRTYKHWTPISDQGLFNTIIWDFPEGRSVAPDLLARNHLGVAALLDAPQSL